MPAKRRGLAVRVETHGIAGSQTVHLILGDIGIHLPATRIDQDAHRLLTTDPLAGFPVGIDVQP
ncbi:hypothetical protein D3C72_2248180 [compost metagenome]